MTDLTLHNAMADSPAADWDALAPPGARPMDPFTTHRFLAAMDASHSTGKGTGWLARPLTLADNGKIIGATPMYVKSHSQGEYIFDHGWAQGYERAGGSYYPKLQIAVPFTPASGPRFLGHGRDDLVQGAIAVAQQNALSSLHITFCSPEEAAEKIKKIWAERGELNLY